MWINRDCCYYWKSHLTIYQMFLIRYTAWTYGDYCSTAAGLWVYSWGSHLVSYRGPDCFVEELNADDGQQADAHSQDDGQPQVGLSQSVRCCTYKQKIYVKGVVKRSLRIQLSQPKPANCEWQATDQWIWNIRGRWRESQHCGCQTWCRSRWLCYPEPQSSWRRSSRRYPETSDRQEEITEVSSPVTWNKFITSASSKTSSNPGFLLLEKPNSNVWLTCRLTVKMSDDAVTTAKDW